MNLSQLGWVFWLFGLVYLPAQVYLFFAARYLLGEWLPGGKRHAWVSRATAIFLLVISFPLLWRLFFAENAFRLSSSPLWWYFTVSTIWGYGSVGSALILVAYNVFRRIILFWMPASVSSRAPDLERRRFLKTGVSAAAASPILLSGYGVLLERRLFDVEHFEIPVSGLSSTLAQFSIVQLTDIHVGPYMTAEHLSAYVEAVNRLKADLIVLTGDFVTNSIAEVAPCAAVLGLLQARFGVYACLGNHDIYSGSGDELTDRFRERGIKTLRNDAACIRSGNSQISILGIEDLMSGTPDLKRALKISQADPGEVKILLSHRPEIFPAAAMSGVDLTLAGHYHGGQIRLAPNPQSLSIARLLTPYTEGFFRLPRSRAVAQGEQKDATLFVSRGIGITALPIRINCSPQIAHLRLVKA
ncbi:MAG: metallophosphoesterase [Candidatus Binatia bacterium]